MTCEIEFALPLIHGLHARPASVVQGAASAFEASIRLVNQRNGRDANAKSVLALVGADIRHGDPCLLAIDGSDADLAYPAMRAFVHDVLPGCDEEIPAPSQGAGSSVLIPRVLTNESAQFYCGAPVSPGIAFGPVVILDGLRRPEGAGRADSPAAEVARFESARTTVRGNLQEQLKRSTNSTERDIVQAHLGLVNDPEFGTFVSARIEGDAASAGRAVLDAEQHFSSMLRASDSSYLQERAADVRDIASQLLSAMYGGVDQIALVEPCVCVSETLVPSQLLSLDRSKVRAIVLADGSETSHTTILARAFGIPLVAGVKDVHRILHARENVVVDARRGLVIPAPSDKVSRYYALEARRDAARRSRFAESAGEEGRTADGRRIEVGVNVATVEETEAAFANGAEGVGLFRTEMIFMDRDTPPDEEEQYGIYRRVLGAASGKPVIFRTSDIGGDKPVPYLNLPVELNPFLGYRAIRFYAEYAGLVQTQLRAILRAAVHGTARIMYPMVCCVEEVRELKAQLNAVREGLEAEGTPVGPVEIGIMVEIPSAAYAIDLLSEEVSFFSIGTNDLAQYFLAVDRGNSKVTPLYSALHPAFIRLLRHIVDTAHAAGRWVGMCGEMAGQEAMAPILAGIGLDEISLSSPALPAMKAALRMCDSNACRALVDDLQRKADRAGVTAALAAFAASNAELPVLGADITNLSSDAGSREEVIKELVDSLYLAGRVSNPDTVEEAVWLREDIYSTGVGYGFAIPHCKSQDVTANSIAILRLNNEINWKSLDGEPVRIVLMLAIREADHGDAHLRIFAKLARQIMHEEFRERLLSETSVGDLLAFMSTAIHEGEAPK